MTENETLIVRLASAHDEVDAKAVGLAMVVFADLINEAQGTVAESERIKISAKPFQQGNPLAEPGAESIT